jgi:hypothetical protein
MIQKEHFRGVVAVRSEQNRRVGGLLMLTLRVIEKSRPSFDWLRTSGIFQVLIALFRFMHMGSYVSYQIVQFLGLAFSTGIIYSIESEPRQHVRALTLSHD